MSDPFLAEIRIFPFNFAPTGWALCDGQLLPLSQNTALFALLGTMYGGNGKNTFALPNIQGRAVMHPSQGPGLSDHYQGEAGGVEAVTLLVSETPVHSHSMRGGDPADFADVATPSPNVVLGKSQNASAYQTNTSANLVQLNPAALGVAGGGLPHNNMQPYLTLNFCIALQGTFPQRP